MKDMVTSFVSRLEVDPDEVRSSYTHRSLGRSGRGRNCWTSSPSLTSRPLSRSVSKLPRDGNGRLSEAVAHEASLKSCSGGDPGCSEGPWR